MTPVGGTSVKTAVLLGGATMASARVLAHLVLVDVEGGDHLDVADVVAAQDQVHETRDELVFRGFPVFVDALDKGRRTVAQADDCYVDLAVGAHFLTLPRDAVHARPRGVTANAASIPQGGGRAMGPEAQLPAQSAGREASLRRRESPGDLPQRS